MNSFSIDTSVLFLGKGFLRLPCWCALTNPGVTQKREEPIIVAVG
jgi:hypothetical protein